MHPPPVRRHIMQGLLPALLLCMAFLAPTGMARAQGVELATLQASRGENGGINLEFVARVTLPRAVEDALRNGVPIYFVAEAQLFRSRWYWRDERVSRVSRSWRVAYQPLTNSWRVSLGGLNQGYPGSMAEAISVASSSAGWHLADASQLDGDKGYYIEFSYKLDTTQLPGPMQFGLGGLGGQGDWAVGVSRVVRVQLAP